MIYCMSNVCQVQPIGSYNLGWYLEEQRYDISSSRSKNDCMPYIHKFEIADKDRLRYGQ